MYKVLFCSKQYREIPKFLKKFLPLYKYSIKNCSIEQLDDESKDADVITIPHIAGSTFYSYNLISKKIIKVLEKGLPPDNWANQF